MAITITVALIITTQIRAVMSSHLHMTVPNWKNKMKLAGHFRRSAAAEFSRGFSTHGRREAKSPRRVATPEWR